MIVEISNGKGRIYHYRRYFEEKGMKFEKRSYGKSFYTKKINDDEKEEWIKYCNQHKLKVLFVEETYLRNSNYRKEFLATKKYKWTICAYCGLPIKTEKITVDHIIPIDKVKKTKYAKWLLRTLKIENVNDIKNLAGACKSCNSKKRTKMGIWVFLGFIGKSNILWVIRWIVRILFFLCVIGFARQFF